MKIANLCFYQVHTGSLYRCSHANPVIYAAKKHVMSPYKATTNHLVHHCVWNQSCGRTFDKPGTQPQKVQSCIPAREIDLGGLSGAWTRSTVHNASHRNLCYRIAFCFPAKMAAIRTWHHPCAHTSINRILVKQTKKGTALPQSWMLIKFRHYDTSNFTASRTKIPMPRFQKQNRKQNTDWHRIHG